MKHFYKINFKPKDNLNEGESNGKINIQKFYISERIVNNIFDLNITFMIFLATPFPHKIFKIQC